MFFFLVFFWFFFFVFSLLASFVDLFVEELFKTMAQKPKPLTKQEFWNAAGVEGKLDVVKKGIEEEKFPVDLRDPSENDTALIKAAYWARFEICEYLLGKGASINAVDNSMGFTGI